MLQLNNREKQKLLNDLINLRQRLSWAAQLHNESTATYGRRIDDLLSEYRNLGQIAQNELNEVHDSAQKREKLATYTFVTGLRSEVKRYMCEAKHYLNLSHARSHAKQIQARLDDIKQMRRSMMVLETHV